MVWIIEDKRYGESDEIRYTVEWWTWREGVTDWTSEDTDPIEDGEPFFRVFPTEKAAQDLIDAFGDKCPDTGRAVVWPPDTFVKETLEHVEGNACAWTA